MHSLNTLRGCLFFGMIKC